MKQNQGFHTLFYFSFILIKENLETREKEKEEEVKQNETGEGRGERRKGRAEGEQQIAISNQKRGDKAVFQDAFSNPLVCHLSDSLSVFVSLFVSVSLFLGSLSQASWPRTRD